MGTEANQSEIPSSGPERKPVPLEYCPPPKPRNIWPAYQRWRAGIPTDPELKRWWWRRGFYYGGLAILFAAIAFYLGPNQVLFGRLTRPGPADLVPQVEKYCVPVVRAMKRFKRDHGRYPKDDKELVPAYLDAAPPATAIGDGYFYSRSKYNTDIEYNFTPGSEGFEAHGMFIFGRIPMPPVTLGPSDTATHPSR